jgi:hypothetical protein
VTAFSQRRERWFIGQVELYTRAVSRVSGAVTGDTAFRREDRQRKMLRVEVLYPVIDQPQAALSPFT